jgi:hypothetical protein
MFKFLIKLALSALIASATWQIGSAYAANYRFKDATEAAALTPRISDDDLRERIMELAAQNDAPIEEENLQIRREQNHIYIDASYVRPVNVVPGFQRDWPFAWSLDVFVLSQ